MNILMTYKLKKENTNFCIIVDLIARTGNLIDHIETSKYDLWQDEFASDHVSLNQIDIQEHKSNADKFINNYGKRLIELCISLSMFIANGRVGADATR